MFPTSSLQPKTRELNNICAVLEEKNTMEKGMLGLLPVLPSSTKRRSKPSMVGRSGGGEFYKKDFESTMLRSRDTVETRMEHFDVCLLEILVLRPRNRSER
jgi:hypothetical protein